MTSSALVLESNTKTTFFCTKALYVTLNLFNNISPLAPGLLGAYATNLWLSQAVQHLWYLKRSIALPTLLANPDMAPRLPSSPSH